MKTIKQQQKYLFIGIRAYQLTGTQITEEQADYIADLIKDATTIEEQNTLIINYLK